jgi:hypothetical protein
VLFAIRNAHPTEITSWKIESSQELAANYGQGMG